MRPRQMPGRRRRGCRRARGGLAGRMQAGAFKGTGSGKAVLMLEYLAGGMERDLGGCLDGRIQAGAFRGTESGRAVVILEYLAGSAFVSLRVGVGHRVRFLAWVFFLRFGLGCLMHEVRVLLSIWPRLHFGVFVTFFGAEVLVGGGTEVGIALPWNVALDGAPKIDGCGSGAARHPSAVSHTGGTSASAGHGDTLVHSWASYNEAPVSMLPDTKCAAVKKNTSPPDALASINADSSPEVPDEINATQPAPPTPATPPTSNPRSGSNTSLPPPAPAHKPRLPGRHLQAHTHTHPPAHSHPSRPTHQAN